MNTRHRIGLFIPDMNSMGGIQRVAVNFAKDLKDRYDVVIISMFTVQGKLFDDPGVPIVSLGIPFSQGRFNPRIREMPIVAARLRRAVAEHRLDTVIGFWLHVTSIAAVSLPRRVRTIGFEHIALSGSKGPWTLLRKWCYPALDAAVSLAEADREPLSRLTKTKTVRVIPNYVQVPPAPAVRSRENILLAVGHVEFRKGLDRLLWALKEPLRAFPDWRFVFVGGAEIGLTEHWYIGYLYHLAELMHIRLQVEYHPGTRAIGDWYDRASIYVMGSRLEGFPLVLLEAKAHGLPVIAYDCQTGPREIVRNGIDGFLVDDGDSAQFSARACTLMESAELRQTMGSAGTEDVATRFTRDRVVDEWCKLIDGLHSA